MKLGPRVALVTTLIMAGVLAASSWALLRMRRADLVRDLERRTEHLALAVTAELEPIEQKTAYDKMTARAAWARAQNVPFGLEPVAWENRRATSPWEGLATAAQQRDAPQGLAFPNEQGGFIYRVVIPLHNKPADDPARQVVALLGLEVDGTYVDREVKATALRIAPVLGVGVVFFGVVIYFLLMSSVVNKLRRLVDAIDAVAKGDLSRAVLPERDDEVGTLAGRFNVMTNSLRHARDQEARATNARLALETRLRHSEKLATMGQMAAEIAHEVGTPLNVIGGRARSLARRAADAADVQKNAEIIAGQVERITKIIRQVLDFSRKSRPTLTSVDVASIVGEALEFAAETLQRHRIVASVRNAPTLPLIPGDPDEIQQVVLNLLMNAVHAMPDGGQLDFVVETVIRRKEGLDLAAPSPYLLLQISDTGVGVPAADRERIFDAFFTTKSTGEGTGLGLAVSKGIVKDHDGWIEVDGRPEGGAIFRVFLPVTAPIEDDDPHALTRTLPPGTPSTPEMRAQALAGDLAEKERIVKD